MFWGLNATLISYVQQTKSFIYIDTKAKQKMYSGTPKEMQ